jgi:hypothetical protein
VQGRRPAYCAFITNDNYPNRTFSVLNIHAPDDQNQRIQAYTAHLYASSREVGLVDTFDAANAVAVAGPLAFALVAGIVGGLPGAPATLRNPLVDVLELTDGLQAIEGKVRELLADGEGLNKVLVSAAHWGVEHVLFGGLAATVTLNTNGAEAAFISKYVALAAGLTVTHLLAAVRLPSVHPPGAAAAAAASIAAAVASVQATVLASLLATPYVHPHKRSTSGVQGAIIKAAKTALNAAFMISAGPANLRTAIQFDEGPVSPLAMNGTVLAGDFNVRYPDNTDYTGWPASNAILGANNAYTALLNLIAPAPAAITAQTSCVGYSTYKSLRVYRLITPVNIQHTIPGQPDYVRLNVTSMVDAGLGVGIPFIGNDAWVGALKTLANNQGIAWATLINAPYVDRLEQAFDWTRTLDSQGYFTASEYDNFFVRTATMTVNRGVVDILGALGSWPHYAVPAAAPALAFPAAGTTLNALAQAALLLPRSLVYNVNISAGRFITFTITPNLVNAEEAAVFFRKYISDHFPVMVEIQI